MEYSEYDGGVAIDVAVQVPPDYKVVLYNDDYTTKDFVVYVLQHIFHKSPEQAVQIMEDVHQKGSGIAGVYTYDIAASRVQQVTKLARKEGFPLRCEMEEC